MGLSKEQCRDLAKQFREVSKAIGDFRFAHWDEISPALRQQLERDESTLLNKSTEMTTRAVGLALDDLEKDLKAISGAVEKARKALKTIQDVKNVVAIAAGVIGLGGAIFAAVATQNPSAIGPTVASLVSTVTGIIAQEKK